MLPGGKGIGAVCVCEKMGRVCIIEEERAVTSEERFYH